MISGAGCLLLAVALTGFLGQLGGLLATRGLLRPRWRLDPAHGAAAHEPAGLAGGPRISVCVPARDEAACIAACVGSLSRQSWADREIIVVDDHSSDGTAEIVAALAAADPTIRLIRSAPLPEGWGGKCHALHQAVAASTGEILLFVDADTVHHPGALATVAREMEGAGGGTGAVDLLVVLGGQQVGTLWERIINPVFWGYVFQLLNPAACEDPSKPEDILGNGQFAAFRRGAYLRAGGHAAVADVVIEDVALAKRAKAAGARCRLRLGPLLTQTRMYRSFGEVWRGFSKNVAVVRAGSARDAVLFLIANGFMFHAELWPWIGLGIGIGGGVGYGGAVAALAAGQIACVWGRRFLIYREVCRPEGLERSPALYLLQPVGSLLAGLIHLNAIRVGYLRRGVWKGRALPQRII